MHQTSDTSSLRLSIFQRSSSQALGLVKSRIWIGPLVAIILLFLMAFFTQYMVEQELKRELKDQLNVILNTVKEGQLRWFDDQKQEIQAVAADLRLREPVQNLLGQLAATDDPFVLRESEEQQRINSILIPYDDVFKFISYIVIAPNGRVVASDDAYLIGLVPPATKEVDFASVLQGNAVITHPFRSGLPLPDIESDDIGVRRQQEVMFAGAPLKNEQNEVIAVLCMRLDPHEVFCRFLDLAQTGKSGETYAFNDQGLMLSHSRFEVQLVELGLLAEQENVSSMLSLELRNPQVNVAKGERPKLKRADQPLTVSAKAAIAGDTGVNVEGYRDYRGVRVVGAWTWLEEYNFGLTTERDQSEAYGSLILLRWIFRGLLGLILLTTLVIVVASHFVRRLQLSMEKVVAEFQEMGQYQVLQKIGQGGMGAVYKAHHSMMRRPTAIKTLDPQKAGMEAIARFEQEVQLTCRLNHPNTIGIYDYGRTPNGIFYYAMEYIEGITLEDLVKRYGALPEGRVIYLMSQVCGSLSEAHSIGLIHRDVKPANIMIAHRGGQPDMVKVFDFGLVKNLKSKNQENLTQEQSILGTPLYMAPEEIEGSDHLDQRVDVYSLGAVIYYLLTGRPPFTGKTITEIIMHQLHTLPDPPSEVSLNKISKEMDDVVLACLDKNPEKRPETVKELVQVLRRSPAVDAWGYNQAEKWWSENVVFEQLDEEDYQAEPSPAHETAPTVINYQNLATEHDPLNKT
ncbi:Serine/threonine-protein kinase PknB [Polystyrenella longa]|uniref:Serine/threonine-protein kinase PknB n=1 Tax=Polystyrenella longa TaxID=2528007 RepID=A0A518CMY3_9PLAN|nr:serine/threonine protein kinase [Polystyrenella longa]QDU80579.1 Serine/threonine-protein kinase PknB [Polystyrenella longa]